MTEKNDDKPVISLVEKREAQGRDFAQERADMIKDLLEFGLSMERATAIAENVLLCDWLFLQARIILARWDLEENTEAVVKLVEMMHRGARVGDGRATEMRAPFALLALAVAMSTAQAQQIPPEGRSVIGPLNFSCGKWVNTPKGTAEYFQLRQWVFGYPPALTWRVAPISCKAETLTG